MNNQTFTISQKATQRLPATLVKYLWKLALAEPCAEKQLFLLRESTLTEQPVQDILHGIVGKEPQSYRVFGFEPVTCSVCVCKTESGAAMFLEGEQLPGQAA